MLLTLHELALLANCAGNHDITPPRNWETYAVSTDIQPNFSQRLGYFGRALLRRNESGLMQIAIVHRGTISRINISRSAEDTSALTSNVTSDAQIALDSVPIENTYAQAFTQHVMEKNRGEFSSHEIEIFQLGHSLGGVHAHLCAYRNDQFAVGFDVPGCLGSLARMQNGELVHDRLMRNHFTILSAANFVNSVEPHFGNVFQLNESADNTLIEQIVSTPTTHRMQYLISKIPTDASDPRFGIPTNFTQLSFELKYFPHPPDIASPSIQRRTSPANYEYLLFESALNNRPVTQDTWHIAHFNAGKGIKGTLFGGHSMLVVEGVLDDDRIEPSPIIVYCHLTIPHDQPLLPLPDKAEAWAMINVEICNYHKYQRHYKPDQFVTWQVEKKKALNMLQHIVEHEVIKAIPFSLIQIFKNNGTYNCTKWALEMLEQHAGIENPGGLFSYKNKPGLTTFSKPHAVGRDENNNDDSNPSTAPENTAGCRIS